MPFLKVSDKFYIIDYCSLSITDFKKNNKINNYLKTLILQLINRNNLKKTIEKSPFSFGVWLDSKYLYESMFKNALKDIKKSKLEYFDPQVFSNSILNAITSDIIKTFSIRGYSNTLINSDFILNTIEFLNSKVKYGFIINAEENINKSLLVTVIFISKLNNNFAAYYSIADQFQLFRECINVLDIIYYQKNNLKKFKNNIKNFKKFEKLNFHFFNIYFIIVYLLSNTKNKKFGLLFRNEISNKLTLLQLDFRGNR